MNRRLTLAAVTATAALVVAAAPMAAADSHEEPGAIPPHPHLLLIGANLSEEGVTYRKCIDIAANQALPLNAHHEHVHFGRAGEALMGAGHLFVPAAPAFNLPWTDCASFGAIFS